jgi:predicted MFS family arabinose efflux permease
VALGLLFLVVVFNLADRQLVNILAQDIKTDLDLSDTQLGLFTGLAFGSVYALVGLPLAWLADRVNRARIIAWMLAVWSLCTVACGLAAGFLGLFLARMGVGAGEGGAQPACTALVRELFPARSTTALAVLMAGNPVGSFVGFLAGGAIAGQWGWRVAFVLVGLPGLVLAVIVHQVIGRNRSRPAARPAAGAFGRDLRDLLALPRIRLLVVAVSASMLIMYAVGAWLPAFFIRFHGLTTAQMGLLGAMATGLCGGLGSVAGLLCDRLAPRVRDVESKFVMLASILTVPLVLLTVLSSGTAPALLGYFLLNFAAFAWLAPATRLIQDAVEPGQRALAFAVCGGAGLLFSLAAGVPLIGWTSDLLEPELGARSIGAALALGLPLVALLAIVGHLRLIRAAAR